MVVEHRIMTLNQHRIALFAGIPLLSSLTTISSSAGETDFQMASSAGETDFQMEGNFELEFEPEADREESWAAELEFEYFLDADFDSSGAEISYSRAGIEIEGPILDLSYSRYDFDWTGAKQIGFSRGASNPWSDLHSLSLSSSAPFRLTDNLDLMIGAEVESAWESEIDSSFSYDLSLGLQWKFSENWGLTIGGEYTYHPDTSLGNEFLPMIALAWRQDAEEGWSASVGIPTEIRYIFNGSSSIVLQGSGEDGVFRLSNDSAVSPSGYAEWSQFGLGVFYEHKLDQHWKLSMGLSYSFEGEWRIYDKKGDRLATEDVGGALGFGVGIKRMF